jgi:hypothetical protein
MLFTSIQDFDIAPYSLPGLSSNNNFEDVATFEEKSKLRALLGTLFFDELEEQIEALPDDWSSETEYGIDDLVNYGSKIWKSLVDDNTGNTPAEGVNWEEQDENIW